MRTVITFLFIFQILGAAALFGTALRDSQAYRVPFGKQFMPYRTQICVCLWLIASLFANVVSLRML